MEYPTYAEWVANFNFICDPEKLISEEIYNREVEDCKKAEARLQYFTVNGFPKPKEQTSVKKSHK